MNIKVTTNQAQISGFLRMVAKDQLPFATSLAINRTAEEVVAAGKGDLRNRFTIRRPWVEKGFRIKRSTKRDPVAEITHKDSFMALQEHGGEKRPKAGRKVAVPEGARPTPQAITTPANWPGALIRKGKAFPVTKGDTTYVLARAKKTKSGKLRKNKRLDAAPVFGRDPALRLMYILKPRVRIPARWGFTALARRVVAQRWPANLRGMLEYALRTAKR